MRKLHRLAVSIDQLWPAVVLAGFLFYVSLMPLSPNDFWWHLKIGEIIFETRSVPTTNMFAWTLPTDAPFVYGAWLGELLLYVLHRWGGLALVTFVRNGVTLAAFWLMAGAARARSGSWRIAALALAFGCAMSLNNLVVRPQLWSLLPFVLYAMLLRRYAAGALHCAWLLACPLIMVFWANAHGAFVLGFALLGIYFAGELVKRVLGVEGALPWRRVGWLAVMGGLTGLAALANPQGIGIVNYVAGLMGDQPSQELVVEWQSPSPSGIANVVFYASILALLAVLAYSRYRPGPTELLLLLAFLWLAWSGQRYVIWYALLVMPILAEAVAGLLSRAPRGPQNRKWLYSATAAVLFVPAVLAQPWWVEHLPLPEAYWSQVQMGAEAGPLVDTTTPVDAVAYLREHPGGKLYHEMGYGSYLIWALPEQGVFVDPRVELYPYEQWRDYSSIGQGFNYGKLLAKYGADRVLLDLATQGELGLALQDDMAWAREYGDAYSEIWAAKQ